MTYRDTNLTDQVLTENHTTAVGQAGETDVTMNPIADLSRPRKSRRKTSLDATIWPQLPKDLLLHPDLSASDGGADRTRNPVSPKTVLSDQPKTKRTILSTPSVQTLSASASLSDQCAFIVETARKLDGLIRTQTGLMLQIKAIGRRLCNGDKEAGSKLAEAAISGKNATPESERLAIYAEDWIAAHASFAASRKRVEKELERAAKALPVWSWCDGVRGLGALSLARIVGATGDLSGYANPAKVWKRMGLAVMADGTRQRKSSTDAELHGYAPHRRALMFVIGDVMVKVNKGEYRALYDARKSYEAERAPDMSKMQAHRRAQRYLEKRLLKNLWQAWRRASAALRPGVGLPAARNEGF